MLALFMLVVASFARVPRTTRSDTVHVPDERRDTAGVRMPEQHIWRRRLREHPRAGSRPSRAGAGAGTCGDGAGSGGDQRRNRCRTRHTPARSECFF